MTAINTNTAALNAQYYLAKSNKEMESSMAKLSSGQKVNSAADDAAGLAIASRMTSQIKGLAMAVKNSNDSMSLAQTAEGAMEEVTNMLQRIRELAVQSANGTMNDSDRSSLDAEVQALKAEIDRVANTTTFNSQKLLDGSYTSTFQIGDKGGQTVGLSIASVATDALGMGDGASSAKSIVSTRLSLDSNGTLTSAVDAGDIRINGQALGAFAATDDVEAIVTNINNNVDNVTASAFNVVVAKNIGDGVTGGTTSAGLTLTTRELGATADTVFTISASSSMTELVNNINNETGGVIKADVNSDGKLVLSNTTGAFIDIDDESSSVGSGFDNAGTQHNGFLKIESDDGSNIRVEAGNTALSSPGTLADLQLFGLNKTISTSAEDGYTVVGEALKSKTTHLSVVENTRGLTGTDEVQHVVNITSAVLADMANSTFTFNDSQGNSISHTFTTAPANIGALVSAVTGATGYANLKAVVTGSGTNLIATYSKAGVTGTNVVPASMSYTKTGSGLETSIGKGDLTLNGVEIFDEDIASDSFAGKLNLINSFSEQTGVTASARFEQTFAITAANIMKGDVIRFNGTEVNVATSGDIDALVTAINNRTDAHGLVATRSGENITLSGENVQALTIEQATAAEISDALVSTITAVNASEDTDRVITFNDSDVHAGRTYSLTIDAVASSTAAAFDAGRTITVTAGSTETGADLAEKFAAALRADHEQLRDGTDATHVSRSGAAITFDGGNGAGLEFGDATITLAVTNVGDVFGTAGGAPVTSYGALKLDSTSNSPIKIDLGEVTTAANHKRLHGFLESNVGAADYDVNAPTLSAAGGTSMTGLSVNSASAATAALATLDRAIDAVNANRGNLGALQNRLGTQSTTCHRSRTQQVVPRDGFWTLTLLRKLLS